MKLKTIILSTLLSAAATTAFAGAVPVKDTATPVLISTEAQNCFRSETGKKIHDVVISDESHPAFDKFKKAFNECTAARPALDQSKLNELKSASTSPQCFQNQITVLFEKPEHIISVREAKEIFHRCELMSALKSE